MGSAGLSVTAEEADQYQHVAQQLGEAISASGAVLVTGETNGIPSLILKEVKQRGGLTLGISPAQNRKEQEEIYQMPAVDSDIVVYTGFGHKGRNVINIRASDIVLVVCGSMGTLNEFTIAYDEGKIIGILEGSGGIADEIRNIVKALNKKTAAIIIYHREPAVLVEKTMETLKQRGV